MNHVRALTLWRRGVVPTDGRPSLLLGSWAALRVRLRPRSPSGCPNSAGTPDASVASVLRPKLSALALWYPVDLLEPPGPCLKEVLHQTTHRLSTALCIGTMKPRHGHHSFTELMAGEW